MKRFFTLVCLLATFSISFAQLPVDPKTQKITFSEVVTTEGQSAADLFSRARKWAQAKGYTVKSVEANSKMVLEASINVKYNSVQRGGFEDGKVHFTIAFFFKEGRYKYKFTSFTHKARHANCGALESEKSGCTKYQLVPASWGAIKKQTKNKVEKIISELALSMKKATPKPTTDDDDNW